MMKINTGVSKRSKTRRKRRHLKKILRKNRNEEEREKGASYRRKGV